MLGAVALTGALFGATVAHVRPSTMRLTATDPQFSSGIQVGDTITLRAVVRDPNVKKPTGTVRFATDDPYDKGGCSTVHLKRSTTATCYLTYYSPGSVKVTATYAGADHSSAKLSLRFKVIPATDD